MKLTDRSIVSGAFPASHPCRRERYNKLQERFEQEEVEPWEFLDYLRAALCYNHQDVAEQLIEDVPIRVLVEKHHQFELLKLELYRRKEHIEGVESTIKKFLVHPDWQHPDHQAELKVQLGIYYTRVGKFSLCGNLLEQTSENFREELEVMRKISIAKKITVMDGAMDKAREIITKLIEYCVENELVLLRATCMRVYGMLLVANANNLKAIGAFVQAVSTFRLYKNEQEEGVCLAGVAWVEETLGSYESAAGYYTRALEIFEKHGFEIRKIEFRMRLASVLIKLNVPDRAMEYLTLVEDSLTPATRHYESELYSLMAYHSLVLRDFTTANRQLSKVYERATKRYNYRRQVDALTLMVRCYFESDGAISWMLTAAFSEFPSATDCVEFLIEQLANLPGKQRVQILETLVDYAGRSDLTPQLMKERVQRLI